MGDVQGRGAPVSGPRVVDFHGVHCDRRRVPARESLGRLVTLWFFLLTPALAQPQAPELALDGEGRFEFAALPELTFIRGIAETQPTGMFQVDYSNPWPAGVPKAGTWRSRRPTQLVDTATNQPVNSNILTYGALTGDVHYAGTWSGDVTARIQTTDGAVKSAPFRIRVLTPTTVYGVAAAQVNTAKNWGAKVCEAPGVSFGTCRSTGKFYGGGSDVAPLVIFVTAGTYSSDFFLGKKRYVYLVGDPNAWPRFVGDTISVNLPERYVIRNFELEATRIAHGSGKPAWPMSSYFSNVRQCCETRDLNGIVNNIGSTPAPWLVQIWSFVSSGMGSKGNTKHALYLEGRPHSTLAINASQFNGSPGCSSVKTTMEHVSIRHSVFSVSQTPGALDEGLYTHTPIDVPSFSQLTVYGNTFWLWRGTTVGQPAGKSGVLHAAIFMRLRKPSLGSDKPAYPNQSWNPPQGSQSTAASPCPPWPKSADTFVSDKFWEAVASKPIVDPTNACAFQHFIGFNRFVQLNGSLPVNVLRDDGSHPIKPASQFGRGTPLRTHPEWIERSVDYLNGNTFEGFSSSDPIDIYVLNKSEEMTAPEPGAKWPRRAAEEFPKAVTLEDQELPPWFKL